MEIIFLGTSHGGAEVGRFCSSICLRVDGASYLIDCGAPVEGLLKNRGVPLDSIKSVFITHMHEDHAGMLSAVAKLYPHYEPNGKIKILFPEEDGLIGFKAWAKALHMDLDNEEKQKCIALEVVREGVTYEDEHIKVTAIPTDHIKNFPSYAYMIEAEGKRLLFTGDLSGDFHDYPEIVFEEEFDVIVCELTHFTVENAMPKLIKSRTKQMIFSHIYPIRIDVCKAQKFPFPVMIANDGEIFEIIENR